MQAMINATYSVNGGKEQNSLIPTNLPADRDTGDIEVFAMASEASTHLKHLGDVEIIDVYLV